ncbi:unnamed protein product, partial [Didymodactylos carnosus]
ESGFPVTPLLDLVQICINTLHLENSMPFLDDYIVALVHGNVKQIGLRLQGPSMLKGIRSLVEDRIYDKLNDKIDQCLDIVSYDWMIPEAAGIVKLLRFQDLRQLLDLIMNKEWNAYFLDFGKEDAQFAHVTPQAALIVVEKIREGLKRVRPFFSRRQQPEKDDKKLLDQVAKDLRNLINDRANS